jgi:hypothetical protein
MADWGRGLVATPFYSLLISNTMLWPAVTLWMGGSKPFLDLTWPMQFGRLFVLEINHHLLLSGPCQAGHQLPTNGEVRGWVVTICKRQAEALQPFTILLFVPTFKRMIFFLFSLNSFNILPILTADLLHILLHLLTYDAVQIDRPLTWYSTKYSNSGTKIAPWATNLCLHYQAVGCGQSAWLFD